MRSKSSEITPKSVYLDRRRFLAAAAVAGATAAFPDIVAARAAEAIRPPKLGEIAKSRYSTEEARTPLDAITRYNNFYEFGSDKDDPARYAATLKPRPWAVGDRRPVRKTRNLRCRRDHQGEPAGGTGLSAALRRGLVDGDSRG